MGILEKEARDIRRRGQVRDALLIALLVGGMVAVGAVPQIAMPRGFRPKDERRFKYYTKTVAHRLVQQKLARWVRREDRTFLEITELGRRKLAFEKEKMKLVGERRRWDKRWRMIAFDLPERRRVTRARLRAVMTEVGFVRLQNSVWVYPHDCEEFVALLKAELKIGKDALYAIVEKIENDKVIREHFHLPLS
jgi:CRISPR-associated endonuclease Cas2